MGHKRHHSSISEDGDSNTSKADRDNTNPKVSRKASWSPHDSANVEAVSSSSNNPSNGQTQKSSTCNPYLTLQVVLLNERHPTTVHHGQIDASYDSKYATSETKAISTSTSSAIETKSEPKPSPLRTISHQDNGTPPSSTRTEAEPQRAPLKLLNSHQQLPPLPPLAPGPLSTAPFTHPSAHDSKYKKETSQLDYERLEFLGDSYLEVFACRLIYARFPHILVGKQNRFREELVRNSQLASYARRYNFNNRIVGNFTGHITAAAWEKILADIFEAYVAAVILSDPVNGFQIAEAWVTALWAPMVLEIGEGRNTQVDVANVVNHKDALMSKISGRGVRIEYRDVAPMSYSFDKSKQIFKVGVFVTGWGHEDVQVGRAEGQGKKEAHMKAAEMALKSPVVKRMMESKKLYDEENRRRKELLPPEERAVRDKPAKRKDKGRKEGKGEDERSSKEGMNTTSDPSTKEETK